MALRALTLRIRPTGGPSLPVCVGSYPPRTVLGPPLRWKSGRVHRDQPLDRRRKKKSKKGNEKRSASLLYGEKSVTLHGLSNVMALVSCAHEKLVQVEKFSPVPEAHRTAQQKIADVRRDLQRFRNSTRKPTLYSEKLQLMRESVRESRNEVKAAILEIIGSGKEKQFDP